MNWIYVTLMSRSQVFLLERRLKNEGVQCELTYMPREIMTDLCNLGIRFDEYEMKNAMEVINHSGLPGCSVFIETIGPNASTYEKIQ